MSTALKIYNPVKNLLIHLRTALSSSQTNQDLQNGRYCGDVSEQYGLDFHDLTNIWVDLFTENNFKWLDFICPFTGACTFNGTLHALQLQVHATICVDIRYD